MRSSGVILEEATLSYLRVRRQGERLAGLTYLMAQRVREALAIAQRLHAGESVAEVKRGLRMPARAAERLIADVTREPILTGCARPWARWPILSFDSRGGAVLASSRSTSAALDEDTIALRAIETITS